MTIGDHMEGFEKEARFEELFFEIREYCPDLKWGQLIRAIEKVAPAYIAERGKRRDCIRKLRYIGNAGWPEIPPADDDEFFKLGQIYVSSTFNGATYGIEGYGEEVRGCAYFEWIKEDLTNMETG